MDTVQIPEHIDNQLNEPRRRHRPIQIRSILEALADCFGFESEDRGRIQTLALDHAINLGK